MRRSGRALPNGQGPSWSESVMRFRLLDRITEIEPGHRIKGTVTLAGSEEYLKDHFPLFPVMPGVLMLEAMFQASMKSATSSSKVIPLAFARALKRSSTVAV